jgi:archaellum component FlaC
MKIDNQIDKLSIPDIRNKLNPIKNLIKMLESDLIKVDPKILPLVLKEIEESKKSIEYLSQPSKVI